MRPTNLALVVSYFLLLIISSFSPNAAASDERCHPHDKKVLLAIAAHFGNSSDFPFFMFPGSPCCDWVGLYCNQKNRVTSLLLINFNLSGTIPPSVANLHELDTIFITGNPNVVGPIPSSITKLKKLKNLDLQQNSLSGPIPEKLSGLSLLDLSSNQLSGTIPASFPKLNKFVLFVFDNNQLSGALPDFSEFRGKYVSFANNKLTGTIPKSFGRIGLEKIDLSYNQLVGDASFLFKGATNGADVIRLGNNRLKFDLTKVRFPHYLSYLELNNNFIYGSIPAQINQLPDATHFNFSYNALCGKIPQGPVTAKFGVDSYFHDKCLCGKPLASCK